MVCSKCQKNRGWVVWFLEKKVFFSKKSQKPIKISKIQGASDWASPMNSRLAGADPGILFGGAKPRSPIESWGWSPNQGREAPEYRGRSPRIEGEAWTEGEAREKSVAATVGIWEISKPYNLLGFNLIQLIAAIRHIVCQVNVYWFRKFEKFWKKFEICLVVCLQNSKKKCFGSIFRLGRVRGVFLNIPKNKISKIQGADRYHG